jgi:predicted transposase YbfD/YdcC
VHLLAVADQQASAVLAQASVDGKTNEITQFAPLLQPLDLAGSVITADTLHTQREHAEFVLAGKHAHYILVVKQNQPSLYAQLKNLPWRNIPAGDRQRNRGHGRQEHRALQAATVAAGLCFPHAAQALRVTRRIRRLSGQKKWRTVTVYAVTSLTASQATPPSSPGGFAATGASRPCTTSATSPTAKTPPRPAPAADPRSWQCRRVKAFAQVEALGQRGAAGEDRSLVTF